MRFFGLTALVLLTACSSKNSGGDGGVEDAREVDLSSSETSSDLQQDQRLAPDGSDDGPIVPVTGNDTCAEAHEVSLSGNISLTGNTSSMKDEFAGLGCGTIPADETLPGAQAYFKLTGKAAQWYQIVIAPDFMATSYIFTSDACTQAAIEADCQGDQADGRPGRYIDPGGKQAMFFQAPADGVFFLAVDSNTANEGGAFTVTIDPFKLPDNTTCAKAEKLNFSGNKVIVSGATGPSFAPPEFPTLRCDNTTIKGSQVYYAIDGEADTTYHLKLTGDAGQYLYVYIFGDTCEPAAIATDCSSLGATGDILMAPVYSGESSTLSFKAPTTGLYKVAVGSNYPFNYGTFTLEISY